MTTEDGEEIQAGTDEPLHGYRTYNVINVLMPAYLGNLAIDDKAVVYKVEERLGGKDFLKLSTLENMAVEYSKFDIMRNCYVSRVSSPSLASIPEGVYPPEYTYSPDDTIASLRDR